MTATTEVIIENYIKLKDERIPGVCRCCLGAGKFISMLIPFEYLDLKDNYIKLLYMCFDFNILGPQNDSQTDDMFLICDVCIERLKDSYTFRCQIVNAQKAFGRFVKLESDADDAANVNVKNGDFDVDDDWLSVKFSEMGETINKSKKLPKSQDLLDNLKNEDTLGYQSTDGSHENLPLILYKKKRSKKKHKKLKMKYEPVVQATQPKVKIKKVTKLQMEKDILSNLDTENLQCKICSKVFLNLFLLRTHINVHYPNHICEVCGKGHATQTRLKNHQRMHILGTFQCSICEKIFSTKGKYENHKGKHILPLRHVCPTCPARFANHYQKQKHLETVHNVTLKRYDCESCPLNFTNSGALNNHKIRTHLQKKSHTCSLCNMAFYHKAELGKHMIVHTGERKYQCSICQKLYPRAYTLREHMKIHNNVKKHVCSECGRAFTQKCTLRGHMKVHGMILNDSN